MDADERRLMSGEAWQVQLLLLAVVGLAFYLAADEGCRGSGGPRRPEAVRSTTGRGTTSGNEQRIHFRGEGQARHPCVHEPPMPGI